MPRPSLPNALYLTTTDTPAALRAGAWRKCPLTGADATIQSAVDNLAATGGVVCLAPGNFNIANPIRLYEGVTLQGSGMAATYIKVSAGAKCDAVQHLGSYAYTGIATAGGATTLTDGAAAWTVDAHAGKDVYIYTGTGAGQRRAISSNTATVLTVAAWAVQPDATSRYRIGDAQALFMRVSGMTIYGNKSAGNAAVTGAATSGTEQTLTVAGAAWTVNQWADRVTVEMLTGTSGNIGQVRRVLSNTENTLTFDGPMLAAVAAGDTFTMGGSGIAMYGPSSYDLILADVWTDECAHYGVYAEETWGHDYRNLISEYNGLDGLRCNISPYRRGTTGAWPASTGASPVEGPKISLSKLVWNLRHGVSIGDYVYDTLIGQSELAGGGTGAYGVTVAATSTGTCIDGNRFVSSAGTSTGAIRLFSSQNVVTGNYIRSGAGAAALTYGIRIESSGNVIDSNAIALAAGTPISDTDGRNSIGLNNRTLTTVQKMRVRGRIAKPKGAGDYITIAPGLGTAPAAAQITCLLTPADAQTEAAGAWSVAGYPAVTASAVQVNCDTALTAATTSAEAVPSAGSHTITLASAAGLAVGGTVRFAAGGVGSVEEDVLITAIAGSDITATFVYVHDSGVAVTPLWAFHYDIGYNDRGTVAS